MNRMSLRKAYLIIDVVISIALMYVLIRYSSVVDRIFLIEEKMPQYWTYFRPDESHTKYIHKGVEDFTETELISNNLLVKQEWTLGSEAGVSIDYRDDIIELNGIAEDDIWPGVTKEYITLEPGQYFISTDGNHDDVYTYLVYNSEGTEHVLSFTQDYDFFTVEQECACKLNMSIHKGANVNHETIAPIIVKLNDDISSSKEKILVWHIDLEEWYDISDHVKRVLENQIKYQNKDCLWKSIIFDDGTGIQYINGNKKSGPIDRFGRIIE